MGFWEKSVAFLGVEVWFSAERCDVGCVDALRCRHSSWVKARDAQGTKPSGCGGPAVLLSISCYCCSVPKLCPTLCHPHGLQHTRPLCFPLSPRVCSNLCPLNQWCYSSSISSSISSSTTPFSLCLPSFPASGSSPTSWLFTSGGQWIGASASASVLPMKCISFRMDWLDLLAVQGTLKSLLQHHTSEASILRRSAFFIVQLSHPYVSTGSTTALDCTDLCRQRDVSAF